MTCSAEAPAGFLYLCGGERGGDLIVIRLDLKGKCYVIQKCLASYHAIGKVHVTVCTTDIARSIVRAQTTIEGSNIYPVKIRNKKRTLFFLNYFHFSNWTLLFYFNFLTVIVCHVKNHWYLHN